MESTHSGEGRNVSPTALPYMFRVTKFDPRLRDERGAYRGDDWTSISEIGGRFGNEVLTLDRYLTVEAAHLCAVAVFARDAGVDKLTVHGGGGDLGDLAAGQELDLLGITDAVRENLRERIDARLENDRFYVHVGFDYYLYVGSDQPCRAAVDATRRMGLFVDEGFPSPQLGD